MPFLSKASEAVEADATVEATLMKTATKHKEFFIHCDRLPSHERFLQKFRTSFHPLAEYYGFGTIATAPIEDPRLLQSLMKAGLFEEQEPVLGKVRAGQEFFLRPSVLLSAVRAYALHRLIDQPQPFKFITTGETFRLGHDREAWLESRSEWGILMIGEKGPIAEAEILQIAWKGIENIGVPLERLEFRINAVGCRGCRTSFRSAFSTYFRSRASKLCKDCDGVFKKNPTNVLTCNKEDCRMLTEDAPQILDYLCENCKRRFRGVLEFLDEAKIPYFLDARLFRDGSWFNTIVYEFVVVPRPQATENLTPEIPVVPTRRWVIAEGGRMSRAAELLVGKDTDAVGLSIFPQLIEEVLHEEGVVEGPEEATIFLVQLGELAKRKSLTICEILRGGGLEVKETLGRDSIKSQLKTAERMGAKIGLILGQKEAIDNTIIVREMDSGIQEVVAQEKLIDFLKRKLKK